MRAFQVTQYGEPLQAVDKTPPVPQGREVLLEVEACGVCHSDVHLWEGYFDLGDGKKLGLGAPGALPRTLGHEIVGRVVAAGPEAGAIEIGKSYTVFPWIGCGRCAWCLAEREELCLGKGPVLGVHADGGYASHVLVADAKYLLDYAGLSPALASTIGCSGITAYGALKKVGRLDGASPLLIMGAGGVGLQAVRLAKAVTGQAAIVADIDPASRQAAMAAGALQAIDPSADGALKALLKATGGVAHAIDFAGVPASANFAIGALRKGGRMVLVGLMGGSITIALPMIVLKAISITGSYVGSLAEMRELLALLNAGNLHPMPVTARPLAEADQALRDLRDGRVVGRVVLTP
jgi:D-arabinose 1-dehydrogenase-like Zn-dependent alcohol dehydrogenase